MSRNTKKGNAAADLAEVLRGTKLKPTAPVDDLGGNSPAAGLPNSHPNYANLREEALNVDQQFQDQLSDNEDESSDKEKSEGGSSSSRTHRKLTFHSRDKCYDLAFLPSGTFILALKTEGFKEYELPHFMQKSSWEPPRCGFLGLRKDSVGTVDCLADERVIVGMLWTQDLVVLRRDQDRQCCWRTDQHIDTSPSSPYRISTWGCDFVAFTGNQVARGHCHPGRHLTLKKITDPRRVVLGKILHFWIYGIALTGEFIVAVSYGKQKIPGSGKMYQLQAFNYAGTEVWHFESKHRMCDISYSSSLSQFYLVNHSAQRIGAIRKTDRDVNPEELEGVFDFSGTKFKPIAASADRNGPGVLALNEDCEEITFLSK